MAEPAPGGLGRYFRYPAPVDPDRREGPARPESLGESFLARRAVCDSPRAYDVANPAWRPDVSDRFRLHRASARGAVERWRNGRFRARTAVRCNVLQTSHGRARKARAAREHLPAAQRD